MIAFASNASREKTSTRKLFAETFSKQIIALERDKLGWHAPTCHTLFEAHAGMQYHFKPELFIQLGGSTEFSVPGKNFSLEAGQACIMPKGVPHGEIARDGQKSFENIVVCYYNETVAIHVAHAAADNQPECAT